MRFSARPDAAEAIERGLKEKSREFLEQGADVYAKT
jgi:hypothetical protein